MKFVSADLPRPNLAKEDSYGGGGVMISAAGGAVRTEPIPKTAGIMNMAKAFITAPLHMAMISDCFVLLVEYSSEVYTRFKPVGIKGRLKTGNAFAAAVTSSGSRLKMLP